MPYMRSLVAVASMVLAPLSFFSQQPAAPVGPHSAGDFWATVKALPPGMKVHISTGNGGQTCKILAVTDDEITCAKHGKDANTVVQRTVVQRIIVTHFARSALVGAGIGGGAGAVVGAVAGRTKPCATNFCLNGIVSTGEVAAAGALGGALLGSLVGGLTDLTRGKAIYTRP